MIDPNRLTDQRRDAWSPGHSGNLAADRVWVELSQLVTAGRPAKEQDDVGLVNGTRASGPSGQGDRHGRLAADTKGSDECSTAPDGQPLLQGVTRPGTATAVAPADGTPAAGPGSLTEDDFTP